ncbi:MAG: hypothetical protein IPM71_08565 [Bacteroidota bacterium]|nr:MAG: hypothetical protein IPM71_08565 [Bacteroidota bacterium]
MEPTNNTKSYSPYSKPQQKVPMFLVVILITLSVLAIVLGIVLYQKSQALTLSEEDRAFVEEQRSSLEGELTDLIVGYDSLKTENDSINERLVIEQDKIRRLLKVNASNAEKIRMYEKELGTLRQVMRSYIIQIDSLNTRNRELTEENIAVKTELREKEVQYQELSETKELLTKKVAEAQKLSAKGILVEGLNSRSKPKNDVDKIAKIRVCFTIRENTVAEPGKKMIYLRIQRPDEVVLSSSDAGMFEYQKQSVVYTAKRELEYDNLDIDMCIYWDKSEELMAGTYKITLYAEGYEIGTGSIELK